MSTSPRAGREGLTSGPRHEFPEKRQQIKTPVLGVRGLACHHVTMAGNDEQSSSRFLTPADVAEILAVSPSQVLKYLRDRQLRGMKLPGKGEWRVEAAALEEFIAERYRETHQAPQS